VTPIANSVSIKACILAGIALLLLIPLSLLESLVKERTTRRDSAVQSVAHGWGDRQWISGPVLAIPVTTDSDPNSTRDWYVLPDRLDVTVELQVQDARRRLGLYDVPVYVARVNARGEFDLARDITRLTRVHTSLHLHLDQARLLLPVKDPRGLRNLTSRTQEFQNFEPSSGFPILTLAASLNAAADASAGPHAFDLSFDVAGTQSLGFLPLARVMSVQVHGNWADPGFTDGLLPIERQIDARGFTAKWQVLNLNRT
jgi:inner membrane protein